MTIGLCQYSVRKRLPARRVRSSFALKNRLCNITTGQKTTENIMGLFTTHGSDFLQLSFSSSLYDGYKTVCDRYENFISTLKTGGY